MSLVVTIYDTSRLTLLWRPGPDVFRRDWGARFYPLVTYWFAGIMIPVPKFIYIEIKVLGKEPDPLSLLYLI